MLCNRRVKRHQATGFTLVELLVTMAILGILAALLFPVMQAAKGAAYRRHCVANYHNIGLALLLYEEDYDDRVPPVNYRPVGPNNVAEDRTWVQTLLPYAGDFSLFRCPSDTGRDGTPLTGPPVPPGESWAKYYTASLHSNLGYNYLYFSPLVEMSTGEWQAFPIQASSMASSPSNTIVFIDSVWNRSSTGRPYGGGSWVIVPPCRYKQTSGGTMDTFHLPLGARAYFGFSPEGWQPYSSTSWLVYGGAWPWHQSQFTIMYADGNARTVRLGDLLRGCDFDEGWRGLITAGDLYPWDLDE
jgi:prepilin-type N-terminal cleavage/methylation domain-containing protein